MALTQEVMNAFGVVFAILFIAYFVLSIASGIIEHRKGKGFTPPFLRLIAQLWLILLLMFGVYAWYLPIAHWFGLPLPQ